MGTLFSEVYNRFLGKITDDMYMELTPEDTLKDLQNLLIGALPGFEFPRIDLYQYSIETTVLSEKQLQPDDFVVMVVDGGDLDGNSKSTKTDYYPSVIDGGSFSDDVAFYLVDKSQFNFNLTSEEINILAILMLESWTQRQVTSCENVRMKYGGSDFKMTSQANHLSKLLSLLKDVQRQSHHMQRLYKRRKTSDSGNYVSNWSIFRESSAIND